MWINHNSVKNFGANAVLIVDDLVLHNYSHSGFHIVFFLNSLSIYDFLGVQYPLIDNTLAFHPYKGKCSVFLTFGEKYTAINKSGLFPVFHYFVTFWPDFIFLVGDF